MKVSSIAIPTIGLGELGYRAQDCAEIAIEEVKTYLELIAFTSVEKIGKLVMVVIYLVC
jgi:O-acetyl-ADP-ribose deacetylase (regulator of RNase III)